MLAIAMKMAERSLQLCCYFSRAIPKVGEGEMRIIVNQILASSIMVVRRINRAIRRTAQVPQPLAALNPPCRLS